MSNPFNNRAENPSQMSSRFTGYDSTWSYKISNASRNADKWIPTISGGSSAGVGTYTVQSGFAERYGLMVNIYFDIILTNHTGTGDLLINVPYKIQKSIETTDRFIFNGSIVLSNISLGTATFAVLQAIPDSYTLKIVLCESGAAATDLQMVTSGTLRGSISYVGQREEY